MKYLMFIRANEKYRGEDIPPALLDAMGKLVEEGFQSGTLKETGGLQDSSKGFRIRSRDGKLHATDGPFTESKEVIGGYALVELTSKEEAREFARRFMELHRVHWPEFDGECEVRQMEDA
jgi:hypothetical protein